MKSQKKRILEMLKQRPVKNIDFYRMTPPILRGGARIYDLRREGYDISIKKIGKGVWEYKLNRGVDWSKEDMYEGIGRMDLKPEQLTIKQIEI